MSTHRDSTPDASSPADPSDRTAPGPDLPVPTAGRSLERLTEDLTGRVTDRLAAVRATGLLTGAAEPALDDLARLVARVIGAPVAVVSLIDSDRQLIPGCVGLDEPLARTRETPLSHSICQYVVATAGPLIVGDLRAHPVLRHNPSVTELGVVAYAGVPLTTADGHVLGSLCVVDSRPRTWTADDVATLEALARAATAELERRTAAHRLAEQTAALEARACDMAELLDTTHELVCLTDAHGRISLVNRAWREALGYTAREAAALQPVDLVAPEDRPRYVETARQLVAGQTIDQFEAVLLARDGRRVVCRGRAVPIMAATPDGPRCIGTRSLYRDVTPEHEAAAGRARLLAMLEASSDYVSTVGPDGHVTYLNAAGRRLLGLGPDTALGTLDATDYHLPATLERLATEGLPTAMQEGRWSGEGALRDVHGEEIPVSMVVVAQPSLMPGEPPYFSAVMHDLRERLQAESALRIREAEHRALLAALPVIVYRVQPQPPYAPLYVSPGVASLGYGMDEWMGAPDLWLRILHPDDRARVLAQTEACIAGGVSVDYEYRVITKDGRVRWLHDRGDFVRDADGTAVAWQGFMVDVTSQRAAEDALRLSELRFRAMFDSAAVGVCVVDDDGTITQANAAFETFLGYAPDALVGAAATTLSPAEDGAITRELVAELQSGRRESATVETRYVRRDGTMRWATLTLSRVALGDGRHGILAVTIDITERRRAEAALERERAFLAATLESLSDGVVACNADGELTLFNRATREFHGLPEEPLPPEEWSSHYNLYRADGVTPLPVDEIPLRRALRGETVRDAEMVVAPATALARSLRASGQSIVGANGEALGAVVAMRDVTDRVQAEAALRESEARYRALVELSPDAILVHVGGSVRYANTAAVALLRAPSAETLVGMRALDLVHPDDRPIVAARVQCVTGDGVVAQAREERVLRLDGSVVDCEVTGAPVQYGGQPGVQALIRDVTARRQATAALRASEARFRAALDASLDAFFIFSTERGADGAVLDFRFVEANDRGGALFSMPPEDLIGLAAGELFPVTRDSALTRMFVEVAETGEPQECEYETRDPRTVARWVWVQVVPLHGGDDIVAGVAVSVRDISAHKQADVELRLLQQVTHALSAAEGVDGALRTALEVMCQAANFPYGEAWVPTVPTGDRSAAPVLAHGPVWHTPVDARLAAFAAASDRYTFAEGEGLPGRTWRDRAPVVLTDLTAPSVTFSRGEEARTAGIRSAVTVPVLADGAVVAVLTFHGRHGHAAADQHRINLLAAVAAQVGTVVRRKVAEAALAEERGFLASVLDSLSENVSVCGADGHLTLFNRATRDTHGLPENGALPPDQWSTYYDVYQADGTTPLTTDALPHVRARATQADLDGAEYVVAARGRAPRTMEANVRILRGAAGEYLGSVCAARDVTDQKAAEAALRGSESRLSLIYNGTSDLMYLMRVAADGADRDATPEDFRFESVNEAYLLATGLAHGAVTGHTLADVLPADAARSVADRFAQAASTGDTLRYDEAIELPLGRTVLETTLIPVLDETATCTHLLGVMRDVSVRRQAEAEVRNSEARFRGVLETLHSIAVTLDATGAITFVNDALLSLTGWSRDEVIGQDWFDRFVPDGDAVRALFVRAIALGDLPVRHESDVLTRGGVRRAIAWDNTLLRDAAGGIVGTASVGRDTTEQRALEARLAVLSEHDDLTGLLNRRGFARMASHALKSAGRSRRHDAVLYLDLDRFKPINDTYGHAAGDEALRSIADVIRATVRDADFGGRLGGDEFAIFAVGLNPGDGQVLAARLRGAVDAHNAAATDAGRPFTVEFSVGIAELEAGDDLDSLLARADAALYEHKLARRS